MASHKKLFGTNGIRGVPRKDLTLEFFLEMAQSIGEHFGAVKVMLGHDGRTSSPTLARAVSGGLMSVGCNVVFLGLVPTPALQYAVKKSDAGGGIMITASHNPPEYNGIKVISTDGVEIPREDETKIESIYYEKSYKLKDYEHVGTKTIKDDIVGSYIEAILSHVDVDKIRKRALKIVIDVGNGVQALAVPKVLDALGCKTLALNIEIDGSFPGRGSEPNPQTLEGLSRAVREFGADVGVGFDGDGDRSVFCDDNGTVEHGDRSCALLVDHCLSKDPKRSVVTNIATSQVIDLIATKKGSEVIRTRVGSVDVSRRILKTDSLVGLEENGGFFYAPHMPVRDGAMATALMLELLSSRDQSLSALFSALPKLHQKKLKYHRSKEDISRILKEVSRQAEGKTKDTTDGIKVWESDTTWVLIRPSGTEPIVRLFAESDVADTLDRTVDRYVEIIQRFEESAKAE
ncbi:MAG: phosphoglucosamine mutase [Thaumarchaeota archaeon]|nr:phosphoglucosamine mutase [Nitrososphaerota archaeon]